MTSEILSEKPRIEIYLGDCLEIMKQIPDKSIDLILTDPPYGIGIDGSKECIVNNVQIRKKYDFMGWDTKSPDKVYFDNILRIGKNQVIFGANYFNALLPQGNKGWVIWDKEQRGLTMSDGEIIYTSFQTPMRIFGLHRSRLWREKPKHPTQKPMEITKYLIRQFSEKGQTILDPFMGSGTTGVACKELGRNFIGIEIEPKYYEIAKRRISQATTELFI